MRQVELGDIHGSRGMHGGAVAARSRGRNRGALEQLPVSSILTMCLCAAGQLSVLDYHQNALKVISLDPEEDNVAAVSKACSDCQCP